ncbi:unnamed protein product, partial [marine sediment metagenome]
MFVLHETCLEYFRRRLSEGWECISLEGHNAVLLSPEGFRRELDLRNDVETLRPNAAGDENAISNQFPADSFPATAHWDKVDEEDVDDAATYVSTVSTTYQRDLYNLPAHTGIGTINFIKIYFRCKCLIDVGDAKPSLKSDGVVTDGAKIDLTPSWTTYSQQWETNPADDEPWEWA